VIDWVQKKLEKFFYGHSSPDSYREAE